METSIRASTIAILTTESVCRSHSIQPTAEFALLVDQSRDIASPHSFDSNEQENIHALNSRGLA